MNDVRPIEEARPAVAPRPDDGGEGRVRLTQSSHPERPTPDLDQ